MNDDRLVKTHGDETAVQMRAYVVAADGDCQVIFGRPQTHTEQIGTADDRQTEHFASGFVIEKNDFRPAGGHRCGGDNFAVPARADDGELLTGCQHVFFPTVSITEAV